MRQTQARSRRRIEAELTHLTDQRMGALARGDLAAFDALEARIDALLDQLAELLGEAPDAEAGPVPRPRPGR